ncbi:ubiquitin carboxyl-terminal hydrolase [Aureococcus anophagefferens]|uniref:ubiquitinyl hydrolase 1 n=1 Tax=Aureococcus anophagefferens TaxID=44056 RepID=A0ABR1G7J4_AURAN
MSWCTIESDPGVFTELVEKFGVSGCEFAELYSLDDGELARHAPVFGLIFLFKWTGEKDDRATLSFDEAPPGLFYAKQMVNNARALARDLSVLLNCEHVSRGATLDELKAFGAELPFDMRGLAIENSEAIRRPRNASLAAEPFVLAERGKLGAMMDDAKAKASTDANKRQKVPGRERAS